MLLNSFLCWPSTAWLEWGLALRVVCIPSEAPLEQIFFSFLSSYQLEIALGLGYGLVCTSPHCWDAVWLRCLQGLWVPPQSPWVHMCDLPCLEGLLPGCSPSPSALTVFSPLLQQGSLSPREGINGDTPCRVACSKDSYSVFTVPLWVYFTSGGNFYDAGWTRCWSVSTAECHEVSFYCYFSLAEQLYLVFLLGSGLSRSSSWQNQRQFHLMEWDSDLIRYYLVCPTSVLPSLH